MELQEVLEARRSVRKYNAAKKVSKEQIEELVKAAILAPSWKNSQTARYHVVLSEEMTKAMLTDCLPEFNAKNAEGAALVVTTFVANRAGFNREGQPDNEAGNGWGFYDLGLHNENFVLKAKEMGLDTLIMGFVMRQKFVKRCKYQKQRRLWRSLHLGMVLRNRRCQKESHQKIL